MYPATYTVRRFITLKNLTTPNNQYTRSPFSDESIMKIKMAAKRGFSHQFVHQISPNLSHDMISWPKNYTTWPSSLYIRKNVISNSCNDSNVDKMHVAKSEYTRKHTQNESFGQNMELSPNKNMELSPNNPSKSTNKKHVLVYNEQ